MKGVRKSRERSKKKAMWKRGRRNYRKEAEHYGLEQTRIET